MANTLEELVVKITADNKELVAALQQSAKSTQDASEKMSKSVADFAEKGTSGAGQFQNALSTMAGFVGGAAIVGAFKKAAEAAEEFFKDTVIKGVDAAIATEDAMQKLNTALGLSGEYSEKASKDMQAFADQMQQTTKYGDDQILSTANLIESLGQLDEQGLKKATKATTDMAAALGIDLNTAALLVGKAAAGDVSTFSRYGVIIAKGATNAETLANTLTALNQKFGGAAAAQLQTYSGQMALLSNNYEDATKQIGFAITKNEAVLAVISEVNKIVKEFGSFLEENQQQIKVYIAEGLDKALASAAMFMTALDAIEKVGRVAFLPIKEGVADLVAGIVAGKEAITGNFTAAMDVIKQRSEDSKKNVDSLGSSTAFGEIATNLLEMKEKADQGLLAIQNGAQGMVKVVNSAKDPLKGLSAEMVRLGDTGKDLSKKLIDSVTVPDQIYEREKQKLDDDFKNKLKSTKEYYKELGKLDADKDKSDLKALQAAHKQQKLSDEEYNKAVQALSKQTADEKANLALKEKLQHQKDREEELTAAATLSGNIMTLAKGQSQTLFELGKAAATATAIINTYEGATKALAQGGIFGAVMAAAVISTGMVQVASIQAQHFAQGGEVPGAGFADSVPSMLTPGETVIDRSTTSMLKQFLTSAVGGSSGKASAMGMGKLHVEISLKDDLGKIVEAKILQRVKAGTSLLNRAVVA